MGLYIGAEEVCIWTLKSTCGKKRGREGGGNKVESCVMYVGCGVLDVCM